ncbi:unnamed protein product [Calicophoron daubneyi]|uniref:Uncharacterized protein n=1 Tax=Calicophoron daubneyi TaxID=300641 RepID=A0AAV2T4V5_CALDB
MESHHADGCSYAIYSLQKISGWEDPDMVSNELHNVVLYVGQSSTFSALSVPQAESIGQSLNAIFQFHDCLEVAVECIEVVLKLMQTDCHWLLKNRILVAVESDMVRMYMMRSSNLRNSVRTCLHSHIFYTMNTGPAIRVLASVCLHEDCDARTREDTIIALQMLLNDFPEAKIPDEELEILMMFLLEKAIDREAIDLYTFKKLFQILEGATLHNSFKNSIENMPDHLRSFYFNRLRWYGVKPLGADQYSFSGHNAQRLPFDKPLASKVNSAFKDEYTDLTYAPAYDFNQFSLKNVSEAVPMALLTQLLRDDTDWHRLRAAEQLHVYYTQKLSNVSPMEAGMFIGDICKNLPALLRMFQKILYDSNPHVILALLETLEVIVTNLPRMIAEKNSPRILETLSSVLGSQDELVRHRVNKFLVRLSNVVSVETVLDKILEDIRTASSTQRMGLLDGLFHLLSAFPWAPWDRIRMTDALSSCLIDHNAQEEQKNDYTRPSKRAFRDEDDATAAYQPLPDQSHMASTRQVNTRIARSLSRVCQYSAQQNDQKNNSQSKSNSTLSHIPVLTQTMPKQNPARPRQIPFVSRSVSPECLSRTRAKIRRRDRSLEPMGQMIRSLQSSEWDRQLEGVEMLKQLLQTEKHAVLNRLCEDPRLMRQVVVDLANASKCLRSQVSRTSLETTRLLANSLRQINEGNKLDPSADMIIDSLLARVAGDKSTKFLQQESSECLLEVCSTISAARAVTSLANRLIDQKIKSPHGRYAVGMVIVHVLNQCSMSENGLLLLLDRMGTDGLHQCILAASILLEDGKSATRSQGRQILQILARIADIEQASHRLLSQRAWRNIVTALQLTRDLLTLYPHPARQVGFELGVGGLVLVGTLRVVCICKTIHSANYTSFSNLIFLRPATR